jgi:ankyrin repeat protein
LTSKGILAGNYSQYHITRYAADVSIAKTCLVYLRGRDYKSKMEAVASRLRHPLTQYAADFWGEHFGRAREVPELLPLALELLVGVDSQFPKWAWLSCIIGDALWTEPFRSKFLAGTDFLSALLYYSALIGNHNLIDAMLDRGAEINSEGGLYGTALSATAYRGNFQTVKYLLSRGADVNVQCGHCGNALQAAASQGWFEIVQLLILHGANVNALGGRFYSALCAALYSGERAEHVVKLLLKSGARFTLAEHHYATTQSVASNHRLKPMFPLYHENGPDRTRSTALNATPSPVHICLAEMLVIRNTRYSSCDCKLRERAFKTTATNSLSNLHFLVDIWKADFNCSSGREGRTVLHVAALIGTPLSVQYLLDLGMDVNQKDAKGWSAIHYAALSSTPDNLRILLPQWRLERQEPNQWSPLHLACQRNLPEALDLLSKAGVSPSTVTTSEPQWKWTLYDIASVYWNENLVTEDGKALHNLLLDGMASSLERLVMETGSAHYCDGCQFGNVSTAKLS